MTNRIGLGNPPVPDARDNRIKVRDDYFRTYADPSTVAAFQSQIEIHQSENQLRRKIQSAQFYSNLWSGIKSALSGLAALLLLTFSFIAILLELPLRWLKKHRIQPGLLPTSRSFWLLIGTMLVFTIFLLANLLLSVGTFNQDHFHLEEEPPLISPFFQAIIASSVMSLFMTAALLISWKKTKQPTKPWKAPSPYLLAIFAYLFAILAMAYFRSQTVSEILASYS